MNAPTTPAHLAGVSDASGRSAATSPPSTASSPITA